jgi:hypothetical protein
VIELEEIGVGRTMRFDMAHMEVEECSRNQMEERTQLDLVLK